MELWDNGSTKYVAEYSDFAIGPESQGFPLHLGSLNPSNSNMPGDSLGYHDGSAFSTKDRDHDQNAEKNCAQEYHVGVHKSQMKKLQVQL